MKPICGCRIVIGRPDKTKLCGNPATTFYFVPAKANSAPGKGAVFAARCQKHRMENLYRYVVDENTYHVAKVMES